MRRGTLPTDPLRSGKREAVVLGRVFAAGETGTSIARFQEAHQCQCLAWTCTEPPEDPGAALPTMTWGPPELS